LVGGDAKRMPTATADNGARAATDEMVRRELLRRRRARSSLLEFTRQTKPDYRVNWHHALLARKLDELVAGRITRLMVLMPPQHGKSELVSRRLPAYVLGRNPDERIIACAHTDALATAMNRDVQRIIDSDRYRVLFPKTRLSSRNIKTTAFGAYRRTSNLFEIVGARGGYRSAGVGGSITGLPCTFGIIDDPFKSREEADSPTHREKIWAWYTNDFYSRLGKDARVVLTHTRWHRDDLVGRLLRQQEDRQADQWEVIRLPAIATDQRHPDDPRMPGEALWPAFKTAEELDVIRRQDARAFQALYQQDPRGEGATEWPAELFGDYIWVDDSHWPQRFDVKVLAVDPSKGRQDRDSDYSAIVLLGVADGLLYVDADLERRPPHRIVHDTLLWCDRYRPDYVAIEANQFQELLVHEFERQCGEHFGLRWTVYRVFNTIPKAVRIRRLGQYIANRELRFRRSPGSRLLVDQLMDFPHTSHDDGPDALEMAVRLILELGGAQVE